MQVQHEIKRTLSRPENLEEIRQMLDGSGAVLRTVLADDVCERFGFFDARGDKQRSTCLKALRDLEKKGHFVLPTASAAEGRTHTPRRLAEAVPAAKDVPATAGAVQGLRVVIVEEEHQLRLWNELMIREHPRAGGPMVGCQIRYLIGSDHGWLGGVGFGASALQLRDRDRWIGWDVQTRRAQLHLHSTLAVTTEGIPLGVLRAQCVAPVPKSKEDTRSAKNIPIEEKKTFNWILGLRDCAEVAREMPHTQLVSVMDREADFFELFDEQRRNPRVELLVRAKHKHNRVTTGDTNLFDAVGKTPVRSQLRVPVHRQSARPKKSKQKASPGRQQRTADVSLRYHQVELQPPPHLQDRKAVPLWVNPSDRRASPGGSRAAPMDPTDHGEDRLGRPSGSVSALVLPALAYRGLASGAQDRMPHRGPCPPER